MLRRTMILLACVALAVLAGLQTPAGTASAAEPAHTLYVAPNGDDGNDGSLESPLATMAGARDAVRKVKQEHPKGDITVYFRGGRYQLDKTVAFGRADSGNAEQTITYAAHPGERPVFSSGRPISGWRPVADSPPGLPAGSADHVWVADVPKGWLFKTLYEGERRLPRAKGAGFAPTAKYPPKDAPEESYWKLKYPESAIKNWPNITDVEVEIIPTVTWMRNILPVKSVDEANKVATMAVPGRYPLGSVYSTNQSAWVTNVVDVLDQPGEWAVNSQTGKVYYWPKSGKPGNVRAPQLKELVRVEGEIDVAGPVDRPVTNLAFRGLTFTEGERDTYSAGYKGHEMQHAWDLYDRGNALVRFRGVEDSAVTGSEFYHTGHNAIRCDLHCQGNTFSGNLVHDVGASGLILAGYGPGTKDANRDNVVANNHVYNVGRLYPHGLGIWAWQSGHNRIAHNRIHDTPYTGLAVSGRIQFLPHLPEGEGASTVRWKEIEAVTDVPPEGWEVKEYDSYEPFLHGRGNVVEYNDISSVMTTLHDGNAIYVSGQARGNTVRRNFLHDIGSAHMGYGLRTDDAQFGTLLTENVIDNLAHMGGITLKGKNDYTGNIVANLGDPEAYVKAALGPVHGSKVQRNVYFSAKADQNVLKEGPGYRGPTPRLADANSDFNTYYSTADPDWGTEFVDRYRWWGHEQNSLTSNPKFYDWTRGDYRMRLDSLTAAMGFRQIDMSPIGLTADFPFAKSDPLDRVFLHAGDNFASVRMGDRDQVKLQVSGRTATGYVAGLGDATTKFTSSDPHIVTVSNDGQVTAAADGTADIKVTVAKGGVQKSTSIAVVVGRDTAALRTLVGHARQLHANAKVGGDIGQYPQGAKDALNQVIERAQAVLNGNTADQPQVDQESERLRASVKTFKESARIAEETMVNDDDSAITYTGNWRYVRDRADEYKNDIHATEQNGASAKFTFTGPQVELIGPVTPNNGRAEVYIDGELVKTIHPRKAAYQEQQIIFTSGDLGPGEHTITITKLDGTYLQLDAIRYYAKGD